MVMNTRWFYLLSKLQREREGGREGEREMPNSGMLRCGSDFNGQSRIHA
jgi:hypothetical protein